MLEWIIPKISEFSKKKSANFEKIGAYEKKWCGVWLSCCGCDLLICSSSGFSNIFSKKENIEKTKTGGMLEGSSKVWHAL